MALRREQLALVDAMFSQTFTSFALLDADLRFVRVNEAFAAQFHLRPDDLRGQAFADLLPDDLDRLIEVARTKRPLAMSQAPYRPSGRPGDEPRYWNWSIAPILDDAATLEFLLLSGVDVTDWRLAEEKLKANETVYQSVFNAMTEGVVFHDADGAIVAVNPAAERIGGRPGDEMLGRESDAPRRVAIREDGVPFPSEQFPTLVALRTGQPQTDVVMGIRQWSTNRLLWISVNAQPVIDPGQTASRGVVTTFHDITERKAADERQVLMLNELNHRVKNTLATVQSIAMQTLGSTHDPAAFTQAFSARLVALSHSHDLLTRNAWCGAQVRELVAGQLEPHQPADSGRIDLAGPDVRLSPKAAVALGMALGELAANAARYGALSVDEGRVSVTWERHAGPDAPRLRLTWRERGGPPVSPPSRLGFGARLIERGLSYELGGSSRLSFEPEGVVCEIDFPLGEDEP